MNVLILLIATLSVSQASGTQALQTCTSPEARAFDFWVGDWRIQQKILRQDGKWHSFEAKTSVSPTLDGCALIEHWEGAVQFFWEGMETPEPMKGLSVRSYDSQTGQWSIHWMDTHTPSFGSPYVGGFEEGRGEFFREWETPQGKRMGRITFSDITPDTVKWELAVSRDEGESWSTLWIMKMHRVKD